MADFPGDGSTYSTALWKKLMKGQIPWDLIHPAQTSAVAWRGQRTLSSLRVSAWVDSVQGAIGLLAAVALQKVHSH